MFKEVFSSLIFFCDAVKCSYKLEIILEKGMCLCCFSFSVLLQSCGQPLDVRGTEANTPRDLSLWVFFSAIEKHWTLLFVLGGWDFGEEARGDC